MEHHRARQRYTPQLRLDSDRRSRSTSAHLHHTPTTVHPSLAGRLVAALLTTTQTSLTQIPVLYFSGSRHGATAHGSNQVSSRHMDDVRLLKAASSTELEHMEYSSIFYAWQQQTSGCNQQLYSSYEKMHHEGTETACAAVPA